MRISLYKTLPIMIRAQTSNNLLYQNQIKFVEETLDILEFEIETNKSNC